MVVAGVATDTTKQSAPDGDEQGSAKRPRHAVTALLDRLRDRLDVAQGKWNALCPVKVDEELPALATELAEILSALRNFRGPVAEGLLRVARDRLVLLELQRGKTACAKELLTEGGYLYRLSDAVLAPSHAIDECYLQGPHLPPEDGNLVAFVDNALPEPLLRDLQRVFAPSSPFWKETGYWSDDAFFSFEVPLGAAAVAAEQGGLGCGHPAVHAALLVADIAASVAPKLLGPGQTPGYAEWWCHSKPHCAGHLLHFDQADDAQVPVVSTVLFLSPEGVGGPTLVTAQRMLDSKMVQHGWLCRPRENRLLLFDGRLLHGVIPGSGGQESVPSNGRRCTLMVALCRERPELRQREGNVMPDPGSTKLAWPRMATAGAPLDAVGRRLHAATAKPQRPDVVRVWKDVDPQANKLKGLSLSQDPPVDCPAPSRCFQGITPWRKIPDRLVSGEELFE